MVKRHLKRLAMPRTWRISQKKGIKFMTRPSAGKPFMYSMSINLILKEMLGLVKTTKETKYVLRTQLVLVNGKRVLDHRFPVGLLDILEIKEMGPAYRVVLNRKGNLDLITVDKSEANIRPVKISGKSPLKKGKLQLNFSDGTNLIVEKDDYATGDVLVLKLPKNEIQAHIKLEKGAVIYLTGGKHAGSIGVVEEIKQDEMFFKIGNDKFETLKEYAFAIGKDKPVIKLNEGDK